MESDNQPVRSKTSPWRIFANINPTYPDIMKSFLRFLGRNPYYTIINILGLSISLMFVILIGDYTWRQVTVDFSQPNKDRIVVLGDDSSLYSWPDISRQIGDSYPEIDKTCCIMSQSGKIYSGTKEYDGTDGRTIMLADSTFFDLFSFDFLSGEPASALSEPDKCVITKSFSDSFFPDENPIGQSFTIAGDRYIKINDGSRDPYDTTLVYQVSAVIEDFDKTVLPNDTKIIANFSRAPQILGYVPSNSVYASSKNGYCKTFYLLNEGADMSIHADDIADEIKSKTFTLHERSNVCTFTPFTDLMFSPYNGDGSGLEHGDKAMLVILLSAMIAILVFAVTNYINLTVANTGFRAKEMATRQLLGSTKKEIFRKLVLESVFMAFISFLIGFALAYAFENDASAIFKGKIILENDITVGTVGASLLFIVIIGSLAGFIPAFQISSFKPIDVVKGSFRYKSKMVLGNVFIGVQNFLTVVMLSVSLVMGLQINYLVNAPLGINIDNVVLVEPFGQVAIGQELDRLPCVLRKGLAYGSSLGPGSSNMNCVKGTDGRMHLIYTATLDKEALDIYGVEVLQDYGDGSPYFNQTFFQELNIPETSREVQFDGRSQKIGGVIKDFRKGYILAPVMPFSIKVDDAAGISSAYYVVETDGSAQASKAIREIVGKYIPEKDMEWAVQDLEVEASEAYDEYREVLKIVLIFTIVALVISIFGFIGMALFFSRQRKSEIAVRKVMGATTGEVVRQMLVKFCLPLVMSSACAVPFAYYIADSWIKDFSYRISLTPLIFLSACIIALAVALISIFWQMYVAAKVNPAESIKSE